jgi:hypothetical protein
MVRHGAGDHPVEIAEPMHPLEPGLFMVRSERTLSRLYHAVKRQLPGGTALLVAPLAGPPKFKGMAPGALRWLRDAP